MRIFVLCLLAIGLLSACSTNNPSPNNQRGVTVVPRSPVPQATELSPTAPVIAQADVCPDTPAVRLIVQERGRSTADTDDPINLRDGPSRSYEVVSRIESGEIFFVLDGPTCADGYAWFYIRYRRNNREYLGWIAEGDFLNYYVEPYLQG